MNSRGVFITGTDTGVGKTWTTQALMYALKRHGLNVAGMKPVASGSMRYEHGLKNDDALKIQEQCTARHPYEWINPYAFREPIAPHIAAKNSGITINPEIIVAAYTHIADRSDFVVVEGVGGWRVPLSDRLSTVDMVRALDIPVVLVIGLRLGCINHALLTAECIYADNIKLAGLVANIVDVHYPVREDTVQTLIRSINVPLLGILPYQQTCDIALLAANLDITQFLGPGLL